MNILKKIQEYACRRPEQIAIRCGDSALTYGELWNYSDGLAAWFLQTQGDDRSPVAVYGHKDPWMLVCFLACVKAGRGYCPIDRSVPQTRVEMILQAVPSGGCAYDRGDDGRCRNKAGTCVGRAESTGRKKSIRRFQRPRGYQGKRYLVHYFPIRKYRYTKKACRFLQTCLNHYLELVCRTWICRRKKRMVRYF